MLAQANNLRRSASGLPPVPVIPSRGFTGLANEMGVVVPNRGPVLGAGGQTSGAWQYERQLANLRPVFQAREDAARQALINRTMSPPTPRRTMIYGDSFGQLQGNTEARNRAVAQNYFNSLQAQMAARNQLLQARQQEEYAAIREQELEAMRERNELMAGQDWMQQQWLNYYKEQDDKLARQKFQAAEEAKKVKAAEEAKEKKTEEEEIRLAEQQTQTGADALATGLNRLRDINAKLARIPTDDAIGAFGKLSKPQVQAITATFSELLPALPEGVSTENLDLRGLATLAREPLMREAAEVSEAVNSLQREYGAFVAPDPKTGAYTVNLPTRLYNKTGEGPSGPVAPTGRVAIPAPTSPSFIGPATPTVQIERDISGVMGTFDKNNPNAPKWLRDQVADLARRDAATRYAPPTSFLDPEQQRIIRNMNPAVEGSIMPQRQMNLPARQATGNVLSNFTSLMNKERARASGAAPINFKEGDMVEQDGQLYVFDGTQFVPVNETGR